jgi:hypothetical protein
MSHPAFCPKLLPILVIGNSAPLVAQVSSALAQKHAYLPIVDEPRIHRPDASNEYIRRHNAAARVKARHIIFVNVDDAIIEGTNLPTERVIRINRLEDLFACENLTLRNKGYLDWGMRNIAIGLLIAMRARKILRLVPNGPSATEVATESGHLVVCEDHEELATIQAANYAYSLGAGLKIIPTVADSTRGRLLEELYSVNAKIEGAAASPTKRLEQIAAEMRALVGGNLPAGVQSVTFVTSGVPWGFGYPERPSAHLFTYPDLGMHLANAIAAEQKGEPGIRVATVIEPGQVNAVEVDIVIETLCRHYALVREYQGSRATVRTVSEAIELFPYDLLFISSHCGDVDGWRWTYNFKDSQGKDRELVVDVAASFAPDPSDDLISVRMQTSFISLDGVGWHDADRDKKLVVGTAITDWIKLTEEPDALKPTRKVSIPRVYGSAAIKVYDHHLLIAPSQLASHNTPIVINNACVSWHRLAETFTFMNARAYLGTLIDVSDAEALEVIKLLFTKYFDRPLALALWHAQNSVYGASARRPYIYSGPHFQRIRTTSENKVEYLGRFLMRLHNEYLARLRSGSIPEKFLKSWRGHIQFLEYEIDALRNRRADLSTRQSSTKPGIDERRLIID